MCPRDLLLALALVASPAAWAQHQHSSPYKDLQSRDIKALSPEQVADLREGRGMGASLPAELNGVPGPMHVLELQERLQVTTDQQVALQRISAEMKASAQRLGQQVVAAEVELDQAFKSGTADEKSIVAATQRIAALNGELRAAHLVAHLRTRRFADRAAGSSVQRGAGLRRGDELIQALMWAWPPSCSSQRA